MKFKAKLRIIGNSIGIYVPRNVITDKKIGEEIELERADVITNKGQNVITGLEKGKVITDKPKDVITPIKKSNRYDFCPKHDVMRITCGCKS